MKAGEIISDDMTLEEKLAAIDSTMANAVIKARENSPGVPIDPASLTICDGCKENSPYSRNGAICFLV